MLASVGELYRSVHRLRNDRDHAFPHTFPTSNFIASCAHAVTSVRHVIPPLDRKGLLVPHFPAHPLLAAPTRYKEGLLDASKPCPGPSGDSLPSMQFQAG